MVLNQGLTWRLSKKSWVMLCVFSMYMVISWVSEPGKFWKDWSSLGSSFREMTALRFSSRFRRQPSINLTLRGKPSISLVQGIRVPTLTVNRLVFVDGSSGRL
jgi:hypothetical protein